MASMLLGSIGSSLLGPLGGFIGSQIGGMLDQAILGALSEPQRGPRIDDLTSIRGEPGTPLPLVFGADRIPGIVCASSDLIETVNKERVGSFLGFGGQKIITYTYHVDIDYMLCEGPILGVGRIWAEGNPIRQTWYAMENETSEYPENIGGLNYPNYYKDHLYDPELTPWSIIRSTSATDDGKFYKSSSNRSAMIEITSIEASNLLLVTEQVVYWKDTATGYYIPLHEDDHGYTGAKAREVAPPAPDVAAATIAFTALDNNADPLGDRPAANNYFRIIVALGDTRETFALEEGKIGGYDIKHQMTADSDFNATASTIISRVSFYGSGANELIDGNEIGAFLGSESQLLSLDSPYDFIKGGEGGAIPTNAEWLVFEVTFVMLFPIFNTLSYTSQLLVLRESTVKTADLRDWPDYWNLYDAINDWGPKAILQYSGANNVTVYPGKRDQPSDPTMTLVQGAEVPAYTGRAHVVFDRLELEDFGNRIPSLAFEVVQYDDVRIADVIENLMTRSGLTSEYYDTTALPVVGIQSHVLGYSIATKTSYRAAMETMLEAFRIDAAEIGNSILFRPRDRGVDWTVPMEDLNAITAGGSFGDTIKLQFRDQVEMPKKLTIRYKDVERNYQANTAAYSRQQGVAKSDNMVELASVMPPRVAKALARDKMRDMWLERTSSQFTAPHRYMYLAPSDIVFVDGSNLGRASFSFKITTLTRGDNGILEIDGVLRETTVYVPDAGEVDVVNTENTFSHAGNSDAILNYTYLRLYDMSPLYEGDTDYIYYGAVGSTSNTWGGASVLRSVYEDGLGTTDVTAIQYPTAQYDETVFVSSDDAHVGVIVNTTLQDGDHEFIDWESEVHVKLYNPDLSLQSIVAQQLWSGVNMAIIGDEVVQFINAEQLAYSGYWKLTGFLRGRRGTDTRAILSGHAVLENFVLADSDRVIPIADERARAEATLSYKAVTLGDSLATTEFQNFTNNARCLVPLSPVNLHVVHEANDDANISWVRRDRAYTAWVGNVDLYNSEEIEIYELEIYSAQTDNPANLVRTELVYDATTFNYTDALQTADGLTAGQPVLFKVAQYSRVIGFGDKAKATI
jgi:hypothetical protein